MSEGKTFVIGDSGTGGSANLVASLIPAIQNAGNNNAASLLAAMNGRNGFGNNAFDLISLLVVLAMFGNNGNGLFGGGNNNAQAALLSSQITSGDGRALLMEAINGNRDAISNLATMFNTNAQTMQNTLSNVMQSLCNIGSSIGLTGQQVINALQQGNMQIAQQLAAGFAQNNLSLCQLGNSISKDICDAKGDIKNGITMLGFQSERQTGQIQQTINAGVQRIVDGQTNAQIRELEALLATKDTTIARLESTAATRTLLEPLTAQLNIIATAVAQLQATQGATATKTTVGA